MEKPPQPFSTVPFDRDPDYVQRGALLEEIRSKLSRPAARVALTGLGGVGEVYQAPRLLNPQANQKQEVTACHRVRVSVAADFPRDMDTVGLCEQ